MQKPNEGQDRNKRLTRGKESQGVANDIARLEEKIQFETKKNAELKEVFTKAKDEVRKKHHKYLRELLEQNRNNVDNPFFHNPEGLSPVQLSLLLQGRYHGRQELICMVCFQTLSAGDRIIKLPCTHYLHWNCAVSNLLMSKMCPGCGCNVII